MSNDDRPKFTVVSTDDLDVSEMGVLTRMLVLNEEDGSEEFMAGIYVGTIVTQLQQAAFASFELDQLHPMPAPKSHLHVVERVAEYFKASMAVEEMEDDAQMVWCSFRKKRSSIRVVQFPNRTGKTNE
jgi:hypothetical protein